MLNPGIQQLSRAEFSRTVADKAASVEVIKLNAKCAPCNLNVGFNERLWNIKVICR